MKTNFSSQQLITHTSSHGPSYGRSFAEHLDPSEPRRSLSERRSLSPRHSLSHGLSFLSRQSSLVAFDKESVSVLEEENDRTWILLCGICFFAVVGCVIRQAVVVHLQQNGPLQWHLWVSQGLIVHEEIPNIIGSFIMGFTNNLSPNSKWHLYQKMITTGFCGVLTTWSSATLGLYNATKHPRYVFQLIQLVLRASCAYTLGCVLCDILIRPNFEEVEEIPIEADTISETFLRYEKVVASLVAVCLVIYIVTLTCYATSNSRLSSKLYHYRLLVLLPSTVAPLGACLRWQLQTQMNDWGLYVPWGTLLSNCAGCVFVALTYKHQQPYEEVNTSGQHHRLEVLLSLISSGFAGSLSTMSSFTDEVVRRQRLLESRSKLALHYAYIIVTLGFSWLVYATMRD